MVIAWVVSSARLIPGAYGDRGIYISVAERLLVGDRLYADVWDNKDPFYYYVLASVRWIYPLLDVALDLLWIVVAGMAVFSLCRAVALAFRPAVALSFGVVPIIVSGAMYTAGAQNLPVTALTLVLLALIVRQQFVWAGLILGTIPFFRLTVFPLSVFLAVIALVSLRKWSPWVKTLVPAGVAVLGGLLLLAARGELGGYISTLSLNGAYASSGVGGSRLSQIAEHAGLILGQPAEVTLVVALLASLIAWKRFSPDSWGTQPREVRVLVFQVGLGSCAGLLILLLSGVWIHHGQLLYIPALLSLPLIGLLLARYLRPFGVMSIALLVLIGLLLGGNTDPRVYLTSMINARQQIQDERRVPLEAQMILAVGASGTYARAGQNDDGGHARGLGNWRLACPHFHQYPFFDTEASLTALVECMSKVDAVVVSPSAREVEGHEVWNRYIANLNAMLAEKFSCQQVEPERICVRKT